MPVFNLHVAPSAATMRRLINHVRRGGLADLLGVPWRWTARVPAARATTTTPPHICSLRVIDAG
jgi:hypothetical protein